jgi:hypothetical protein
VGLPLKSGHHQQHTHACSGFPSLPGQPQTRQTDFLSRPACTLWKTVIR